MITTIIKGNHNTYGGCIYESDFNLEYTGTRNIAQRIISDWAFDKQCKENIKLREKKRSSKNVQI